MAITDYHKAIFTFLEAYRSEHPDSQLTYYLRKNNTADRPRNLFLFTGNDSYISVGLYTPHNGNTKTRSIGFLCQYDSFSDKIKQCYLELVYDDPKLAEHEGIYEQIIERISSIQFKPYRAKRYRLTYKDSNWQKNLTTYLEQHKPIIDEIIRQAGATETFFVRLEDLEADIKTISQLAEPVLSAEKYTWISFYRELCSKLLQYSSEDLIQITKLVLEAQKLPGLQDQDADGNIFELAVIDPYTVLSFTRLAGEDKRRAVSAVLKEQLAISAPLPTDFAGLYTDKNQWIWAFGYSHERAPDDPDKLRQLYQQVEQDTISEDLFNQVLAIRKLRKGKLTESLFSQWPDRYLPINSRTKLWLRKRNLPAEFTSYSGYDQLLKAVRQHDRRPFYEISEEAYQESMALERAGETNQIGYWIFQGNPSQFRIVDSLKDGALQTWRVAAHAHRIKPGDKVILWVVGDEAGCYALAEVASDVYTGNDEAVEQYYQTQGAANELTHRVKITLLLNLWDRPVLKVDLQGLPAFTNFKGGNQGTNFTATQEQYAAIELLARPPVQAGPRRYWKYSPGRQAVRWPDDLRDQVMAINFSAHDTGPLDQYATQVDLDNYLGKTPKASNETWNMVLFKDAVIGDVVFANRGLNTVAGIGVISGPYHYRDGASNFQHIRDVKWLADQPWQYMTGQFSGNKNLFRPDTFTPTLVGPQIIEEYVKQYPQYRPLFEQHGLLNPIVPEMDNRYSRNIILYGPPGTGKTFGTIDLAVGIAMGRKDSDHKINKAHFDQLRKEGQIEFITFHQNYSYEDFVMGLKPDADSDDLKFQRSYGIFYRMAKRAQENYEASQPGTHSGSTRPFEEVFDEFIQPLEEDGQFIPVTMAQGKVFQLDGLSETSIHFTKESGGQDHSLSITTLKRLYDGDLERTNGLWSYYKPLVQKLKNLSKGQVNVAVERKQYVLIIDEINRANMSRVFGELITLLEEDKRLGGDNALTITLPSGEPFSVPPNLYLIGTMNTADKSLALLDIALRRRFEFVGMYPNYEVLDEPAKGVLQRLNKAILNHHKPADFLIGHAYFMNKQSDQLPRVFNNRVIPLLMEYFNGRTDLVKTLLTDAGIDSERNPLTDQLAVSHVG